MEEITQSATMQFFQYGVLGVLVVVFAAVIFQLWREGAKERKEFISKIEELTKVYTDKLEKIQQLRIEDSRAYQNQFVDLVKGSTQAMMQVASLLESTKDTLSETKDAMRQITNDLRKDRS